jgi:hypothetical protein
MSVKACDGDGPPPPCTRFSLLERLAAVCIALLAVLAVRIFPRLLLEDADRAAAEWRARPRGCARLAAAAEARDPEALLVSAARLLLSACGAGAAETRRFADRRRPGAEADFEAGRLLRAAAASGRAAASRRLAALARLSLGGLGLGDAEAEAAAYEAAAARRGVDLAARARASRARVERWEREAPRGSQALLDAARAGESEAQLGLARQIEAKFRPARTAGSASGARVEGDGGKDAADREAAALFDCCARAGLSECRDALPRTWLGGGDSSY